MKYCLIGEKLPHSYSKDIHGLMGLDYSLIEVDKDNLGKIFSDACYDGFNVTIPYKKDVIPFLYGLDENAKLIGSVNTVVKKDGNYYGYNTDIDGMKYMISRKNISLKSKVVLILGSGGTSLTATALCKKENAKKYYVVSRSGPINYENVYALTDVQIIINCTPVGMFPNVDNSPIDLNIFDNLIAVFDCIYNPCLTTLLQNAKNKNLIFSNGLSMLVKQALVAETVWTGKPISDKTCEKIIKKISLSKMNIILSGMPSCGKSTIGKILKKTTGRELFDTDKIIYSDTGKTPAEIILNDGEDAFRKIETETVKKVALNSGVIISLGGGAVLKEENVSALKKNGIIFFINRSLNLLTDDNRPLSEQKGIQNLYNERKDIYNKTADFTVKNNSKINDTAREILKLYENSCY